MLFIIIEITCLVSEDYPGFVECVLVDAFGQYHIFIEKVPIVTAEDLWSNSAYPRQGEIAIERLAEWKDEKGRWLTRVSTKRPWGTESTTGETEFVVSASQIVPSSDP
jgi:hypothetical protein